MGPRCADRDRNRQGCHFCAAGSNTVNDIVVAQSWLSRGLVVPQPVIRHTLMVQGQPLQCNQRHTVADLAGIE